jgi:phosphatidate cytidylyltransferase
MQLIRKLDAEPHENIGLLFAALFLADAHFTGGVNAMPLIAAFFLVTLPLGLLRREVPDRALGLLMTLAGTLYLTVLPGTLLLLRNPIADSSLAGHGGILVTFILLITWAMDSGAYYIGKFYGRTPFFSHISPKKTWEGAIGGLVSAMAVGGVAWIVYVHNAVPLGHVLGMSLLGGIAGPMGDLIQSRVKRLVGVKDSASVIPGHGGVWDRFDSLICIAPVLYGYIWYFLM